MKRRSIIGPMAKLRYDIHQYRSYYIEQEMDHGSPLGILLAAQGCQQRGGTRADITTEYDKQTDGKLQQP